MSDRSEQEISDLQLKALYQAKANEEPSAELDARILAMASQHQSQPNESAGNGDVKVVSFWRQYRWPLSSAASVLLLSSLLLLNLNQPQPPITEQMMPMMVSDQAVESMRAVKSSDGASQMQPRTMSQQAPESSEQQGPVAQSEKSHKLAAPIKADGQAKANISDIQAVNHLQQLVDSELWSDADTLYQRLLKERPRLQDSSHPQHAQWLALVDKIKAHRQGKE